MLIAVSSFGESLRRDFPHRPGGGGFNLPLRFQAIFPSLSFLYDGLRIRACAQACLDVSLLTRKTAWSGNRAQLNREASSTDSTLLELYNRSAKVLDSTSLERIEYI